MKIAIIGSGISGLTSAWYLHQDHDITLFEANDYIGGHTATVDVTVESGDYAIDTGFIVFNDRTYPHFEKLMAEVGIVGQPTEMSFSVRNEDTGLEYNGHTISTLFAQKRNLFRPSFYRFLNEILRFNKLAKTAASEGNVNESQTLGAFLAHHNFSDYFAVNYILPMGAAIWSSTLSDMRGFPLGFFLRFFLNHGLLDVTNRPQWAVIPGGSREYIRKMTPAFEQSIALSTPVQQVIRHADGVTVTSARGDEQFDHVIFACHSDQALALLADKTQDEIDVLSAMTYQDNEVVLHTDTSLLPKARAAWAAWNYHLPKTEPVTVSSSSESEQEIDPRSQRLAALTYDMNILQGIDSPETFCVTLNQTDRIDPDKILRTFTYAHPVFTTESIAAQQQRPRINGVENTWFCGAYWYNGFHEDGVRSALDVVNNINLITIGQGTSSTQRPHAAAFQATASDSGQF
ncbi:NAD(P)/FAD-dependent oxidoreductase [Photobacterium sanguinicancri]|uniref:NAD(P)/FAD-dependent oxidoreductase n=1 Tax=Photobacterium sanguinicancri TaxID=875932 RepID=UPI0007886891|nr:FAD-dependent oxidoreductase [Photobacterium sanguinicancri]KXI23473.1 FAD-dependent oxidoreductase [Photobacterium sanguinicancri]